MRELDGINITEDSTTRQTYRAINDILKPEQLAISYVKVEKDGKTFEDPQEVAELFNVFFPEKVRKLAAKIKKQYGIDPLEKLRGKVKELDLHFELKEVQEKDVMKILKKLKNKSSYGSDGISSEVLKMGADVLCVPLTLIINISILSGKFPTAWKEAKCKPLFSVCYIFSTIGHLRTIWLMK